MIDADGVAGVGMQVCSIQSHAVRIGHVEGDEGPYLAHVIRRHHHIIDSGQEAQAVVDMLFAGE